MNVYKYICRNPVEVNLSEKAEDYPYGTLFYQYHNRIRAPFKIEKILPAHAFDDYEDLDELKWINQKFEREESKSVSCGLQKSIFAYEKDRSSKRPIVPVVRHPWKKSQDELWDDMFGSEEQPIYLTFNA